MGELSDNPVDAPGSTAALTGLGDTADQLRLLCQEVNFAAVTGSQRDLIDAAEQVLPLLAQFARRYRAWLAAGHGVTENRMSL